jgi:hypothetical protein
MNNTKRNRGRLLRKGMRSGDNFLSAFKKNGITVEKIKQQNLLEIATMRFETIIAEANQEVTLKLAPAADIEGVIIIWQRPLPPIN